MEAEKLHKSCFVIAPIGDEGTKIRERSDMLLEHIFIPALQPLGYSVVRADKISQPGSITLQVLERILKDDLVIADLTGHNPNVFYELAVRHAVYKGVIHVICAPDTIPFDVADLRTVTIALDIPGAAKAKEQITAQALELEKGNLGQTPIALANILKVSDTKESDSNALLREMIDRVSELGTVMRESVEAQRRDMRTIRHQIREERGPFTRPFRVASNRSRVEDSFEDTVEGLKLVDPELYFQFKQLSPDALRTVFNTAVKLMGEMPDVTILDSVRRAMNLYMRNAAPPKGSEEKATS